MNFHRLQIDGFIDPKWWRDVHSQSFTVKATANGKVDLNGKLLSDCPYPEGTELHVRINRNVECISIEELNRHRQEAQFRREEKEKAYTDKLNRFRKEAEEFYACYTIPFQFSAAITGHLNGLTKNSAGNGFTRSTVIHLMALQDFSEGRFKRRTRDKICLSTGKNYSDQDNTSHYSFDGTNLQYTPKVTCKKCIEIMDRWKNKS